MSPHPRRLREVQLRSYHCRLPAPSAITLHQRPESVPLSLHRILLGVALLEGFRNLDVFVLLCRPLLLELFALGGRLTLCELLAERRGVVVVRLRALPRGPNLAPSVEAPPLAARSWSASTSSPLGVSSTRSSIGSPSSLQASSKAFAQISWSSGSPFFSSSLMDMPSCKSFSMFVILEVRTTN